MFINLTNDEKTIVINTDAIKYFEPVKDWPQYGIKAHTLVYFLDDSHLSVSEGIEEILAKGLPREIKTENNG